MTDIARSIALITPLKDERDNIDTFLNSVKGQSIPITYLVIVENDSTDGSREYLDKIEEVDNVACFKVIHMSFEDTSYRVGKKYATIISEGIEFLRRQPNFAQLDFIGILDCDVFPEDRYYEKLTRFMEEDLAIGISSGITYTEEGVPHIADPNFVRGNSRLWKKRCFDEAGYRIAFTADTVSVALAHLKGWKTKTLKSASVISREVNVRIANSKNKGYHAYYRGHTLLYVFFKSIYWSLAKNRFRMGLEFFQGYLEAMVKRKPRIEDPEVREYFRYYLWNKLTKKYN